MRITIKHTTHYAFSKAVAHGLQRLRMHPKETQGQRVINWQTELEGLTREAAYEDQHHNQTMLVSVQPGARAVSIKCFGTVETSETAGIIGQHSGHMPLWAFVNQTPLTRPGPAMRAIITAIDADRENRLALLHGLSRSVLAAMRYEIGSTDVRTNGEDAAAAGHGVCQDHAHVFVGCARALGVPARYVSGYLMMNDRIDQEAGHAWAEAHIENIGWVGFDVSNAISPDERYIRVATGCDYRDAAPVTGISWGDGEIALAVSLAVEQQTVEQ